MPYPIIPDHVLEFVFIGVIYFLMAPLLGIFASFNRNVQRGLFVLILVLIAVPANLYSTSLYVWQGYRGLPIGFLFSVIEASAIALLAGCLFSDLKQLKLLPAGLFFYLLYCALEFPFHCQCP